MTDLERAKEALTTIDCTCALCRDEEVRTTQLRGVAPLLSSVSYTHLTLPTN
mgnify:CR=1 FL=1